MQFDLAFSPFACVLLMLFGLLLHQFWWGSKTTPAAPKPPRLKRGPKPFAVSRASPMAHCVRSQAGLTRRHLGCRHDFLETLGSRVTASKLSPTS